MVKVKQEKLACFHCGDTIQHTHLEFDNKDFCCNGCQQVYALLSENNLCEYYNLQESPGINRKNPVSKVKFNFLEDEQIKSQLIQYADEKISRITFHIPTMHCSSCIWLLESLYKLEKGVKNSRVDFLKKQIIITFDHHTLSLKALVELLTSLGYEPSLNLNDLEGNKKQENNNRLLYRVGVAGFCFGNIMLISFPEYFGLDAFSKSTFSSLFGYLNFFLALPTFLYSSQDYFISAYKSLRRKIINIDFPLALGILVMFVRSSWEIFSHTGLGYFDTLAGLVFFLLLGKWVQQRTIDTISFERDYKSYFPVAVSVINDHSETTVPVSNLKIGDRILIRNNEIIPADSILLNGDARIDFSFVTGESVAVHKTLGELVYAGGRQTAGNIELEVCKHVSQSYLTQLWNSEQFSKDAKSQMESFQTMVSRYFTFFLLGIAITSALFWLVMDSSKSLDAFTAVLIIACPCALALSSPFALGNAMRLLGRAKLYLKGPEVVEKMAKIQHIVFDKTGTLTDSSDAGVVFHGAALNNEMRNAIYSLCNQSVHPLSKKITAYLKSDAQLLVVDEMSEVQGKGLSAKVNGNKMRLGSSSYMGIPTQDIATDLASLVYVEWNDEVFGYFEIKHAYRQQLGEVLNELAIHRKLSLLSGDRDTEREIMKSFFPKHSEMLFNQSPADKMLFIDRLRLNGETTAMIGDGLNDAGALKVADLGISVTENTAHFSPASDAIMDAGVFEKTAHFFQFANKTLLVIRLSFVISLLYNLLGLSFAVQGVLSPVIAAVLMPLSSISVIVFTTGMTSYFAYQTGILNHK
ncbi:MAG: heavy metal translocating P-type ATPase [Bacteroidia bacterium]